MNLDTWSHPNPIFMDFETQSACDLREYGSRIYAAHPSTRVLILTMCVDDVFHVWIPKYVRCKTDGWAARLWPYKLKPRLPVHLYRDASLPRIMVDFAARRPLVAHNAFGFDRLIWDNCIGTKVSGWIDTLYLARIEGRPGKLDALSLSLGEDGKDRAKKLLPLLTTARVSVLDASSFSYPVIRSGDLQAFTTYSVKDVELLRRMWSTFADTPVEADVIAAHEAINSRGIAADMNLLSRVEALAAYSTERAVDDIADLTDGKLNASNIRSPQKVHAWLATYGISIVDDRGKPVEQQKLTLRKDIVQKFIDSPYLISEYMVAAKEIPPRVLEVLKLRMKALRITDAKVARIQGRAHENGRIRDMQVYHAAHTGRWSSQIHNLPKSQPAIAKRVEELITTVSTWKGDTKDLYERLRKGIVGDGSTLARSAVTVDDVCSALIRPSLIASKGKALTICDYSSIEGRGTAWIAGEEKQLALYRAGRDIYREFAASVFKCDPSAITQEQRDGIGKIGILGLGYSMSGPKFRVYAANWGVDLVAQKVSSEEVVETYRDTYTKIAGFRPRAQDRFRVDGVWQNLDKAVKECVGQRKVTYAGRCEFRMLGRDLICTLPSGRRIYYPDARIEDIVPPYCYTLNLPLNPKATVVYTGARGTKSLYGGILTENVVQAICRDLLACALVHLEDAKLCPVFHAHDEVVDEVEERSAETSLRKQVTIMSDIPSWADGFPIACEGFVSDRFVKKAFEGSYKFDTASLTQKPVGLTKSKGK